MRFPKVKRNTLLFIAGTVWLVAGFNIMRIGTPGMIENWTSPLWALLISALIFGLFYGLIFHRMVKKHCTRIQEMEDEKIPIYRFFDRKAYCIMAFMITFGVLLRASGWIPPYYLGIFYTGLGFSLMTAGVFFLWRFARKFAV